MPVSDFLIINSKSWLKFWNSRDSKLLGTTQYTDDNKRNHQTNLQEFWALSQYPTRSLLTTKQKILQWHSWVRCLVKKEVAQKKLRKTRVWLDFWSTDDTCKKLGKRLFSKKYSDSWDEDSNEWWKYPSS